MTMVDVAAVLTDEHREIDAGIEQFMKALTDGRVDSDSISRTCGALRRHIYLEEELLFPPIGRAGMVMPLMVMRKEHGEVWQLMDSIDELLHSPEPDGAALRSACQGLLAALDQHNSKEEPIVYPRAVMDLSPEEAARLADFISTGTFPPGWVCEELR